MEKNKKRGVILGAVFITILFFSWNAGIPSIASKNSGQDYYFYSPALFNNLTSAQWIDVGVSDIPFVDFEIDPNNPETIFAGATFGMGMWRSQDNGQNWTHLTNGIPMTLTVKHLAVASTTPTVIYAGVTAANEGFYRSDDGGDSWVPLPRVHAYRMMSLAVNPVTPSIALAGFSAFDVPTYGGEVFRTANAGLNWSQVLPYGTLALDIVVDPKNTEIVYVASSTSRMLKSVDGGNTWFPVNNGLPLNSLAITNILLDPMDTAVITITTTRGLYRSLNGGESWESIGMDLPVPWLSSIAYVPDNLEILFATPVSGNASYGIFQSSDGGSSWEPFAPLPVQGWPLKMDVQGNSLFILVDADEENNSRLWRLNLDETTKQSAETPNS